MSGVVVTTGAVSGPSAPGRAPASTFFVVGQSERGPVNTPTRVQSLAEFQRIFGGQTTFGTLYDQLRCFFEEGGTRAWVVRIAGDAATIGNLSTPLQDRATTPAATLAVAASSPGAWSSRVSVQVLDGPTSATFRLQVLLDGVVVEDFGNLASPAEAVARVNDSTAASAYVRLTNVGSASTAPQNNPKAQATPVTLSAGDDKRASIVAATYTAALGFFAPEMGDGAVAIPGMGSTVHAALLAHATANNRIALLTAERTTDSAALLSMAAALDNPRGGLFFPWIKVPDSTPAGGTKVVSPEGYVAAARARAHEEVGPWKAGAGQTSKARWVLAADLAYTNVLADSLDRGKVNVIQTIGGAVRVYGWRSLSNDPSNWRFLSAADVINRVVIQATEQLEQFVFETIDPKGQLLSRIAGVLEGIVKPLADAGGLFPWLNDGTEVDPGYRVTVDESINPVGSLADNRVFAQLGLRPAPTAALVYLTVTKAAVTASL